MLLNCHTYYSFCYGTYTIDDLLTAIEENGYVKFVLTDINNTSACLETIRQCQERPLKPVVGIDFRNGVQQKYIAIAMNNDGFKQINTHLTHHLHNEIPFPDRAPFFEKAYVVYPLACYKGHVLNRHEYIGVGIKDLSRLPFSPYKNSINRMVVVHPVSFAGKREYNAHRLLRAIDKNCLLSKLDPAEQASADERIVPLKNLLEAFKDYPVILKNTKELLQNCTIHYDFGKLSNKNLRNYTNSVKNDLELLRIKSQEGLQYRYSNGAGTAVIERLEKELEVIEQMGFAAYFLINWDIVSYAQSQRYYYVGRGSGANSLVAYLLRITDVDPIELDLYFERFINIYRNNPPDFDIDFSWTDRDDMTRYIFDRFGRERTALLGAYNTFQKQSVIRELGKVFGLPPAEIDALQDMKDFSKADEIGQLIVKYSSYIHDFPSHLSIHSSGILISEEPIMAYSATFMPPKGYPTTQFSMIEAEDIGLYKFDILSQRGLGKIKDALTLIEQNKNTAIDIHNTEAFKQDEAIKNLLRVGKTIGCFYVESPAMRMLLTKLRADDYLRLVAASSIIRPGVAKSGMMREYILRYQHPELREKAKKELPHLYEILEETYGVMVYQEDVIKVAHYFAGLSLAEADYLRRGMSWKFKQRNEFFRVKENFFENCREKGYAEKTIADIWLQIESFANYAFSKGHSASYAVESYQALYLKAYFPLEYMVATLNNGGGFYRPELYIHEARMHGAIVHPPCVNHSEAGCVIQGNEVYLGFTMVAELTAATIQEILRERSANGAFKHLDDFLKRVQVSLEQLRLLIRVGAFHFTGKSKRELLWDAHLDLSQHKKTHLKTDLFEVEKLTYQLPNLETSWIDDAYEEKELLGFTLRPPFYLLKNKTTSAMRAMDLKNYCNKEVTITGYLITIKYAHTYKGEQMFFGTFIDEDGYWIDTVHFPPVAKAYPFRGRACYSITGVVKEEFGFYCIEVTKQERLEFYDRDDCVDTNNESMNKVIKNSATN